MHNQWCCRCRLRVGAQRRRSHRCRRRQCHQKQTISRFVEDPHLHPVRLGLRYCRWHDLPPRISPMAHQEGA